MPASGPGWQAVRIGHENSSVDVFAERLRRVSSLSQNPQRSHAHALLVLNPTHHQSGSASRRSPAGHVAPIGQRLHVPPGTRLKSPPLHAAQKRSSLLASVPGGQGEMVTLAATLSACQS